MIKTILRNGYCGDTDTFDKEINDAVKDGWKIKSIEAVPNFDAPIVDAVLFAVLEKPNITYDD